MKTFIKWAGGKEKELSNIVANLPQNYNRYIEPFVGGGAVYFNIKFKKAIINDKCEELIHLYECIKEGDEEFFKKVTDLYHNWILLRKVVENNSEELLNLYKNYCNDSLNSDAKQIKIKYTNIICEFVIKHSKEFNGVLTNNFNINIENFIHEIQKKLYDKIKRMYIIECKKGEMNDTDILQNIECSLKSAFYVHFRYLYNYKEELNLSSKFATAIFYFIREYCYSSMFRYNSQGKFNVPYGGISYNRKDFLKKIEYIKTNTIKEYMSQTEIYNMDFEEFCNKVKLKEDDFVFLDPPYDTEFSTYSKNEFNKDDQIRLADYLSKTKAKFMLIIKNTDFILNLYKDRGFNIEIFEKKYLVSFMNRNEKGVEHLLITNYRIEDNQNNV